MSALSSHAHGIPAALRHEWFRQYTAALVDYVARADESGLRLAQELGRKAILDGLGLWEVAAIHHDALRAILSGTLGIEEAQPRAGGAVPLQRSASVVTLLRAVSAEASSRALASAKVFFAETLLPFETEQRELRDEHSGLLDRSDALQARNARAARELSGDAGELISSLRRALGAASGSGCAENVEKSLELLNTLERRLCRLSGELCREDDSYPLARLTFDRRAHSPGPSH